MNNSKRYRDTEPGDEWDQQTQVWRSPRETQTKLSDLALNLSAGAILCLLAAAAGFALVSALRSGWIL